MYEINKYIVHENNTVCTKFASADTKKYQQFCTMHGLNQLIHYPTPTRVTSCTSALDHILASFSSRVSQKGVINLGLSGQQRIFCTHKIFRFKTGWCSQADKLPFIEKL